MESQPQYPEFRINPDNFHPWYQKIVNIAQSPYNPMFGVHSNLKSELCYKETIIQRN